MQANRVLAVRRCTTRARIATPITSIPLPTSAFVAETTTPIGRHAGVRSPYTLTSVTQSRHHALFTPTVFFSSGASPLTGTSATEAEEAAFRASLGRSEEDAFGQFDPLDAVTAASREAHATAQEVSPRQGTHDEKNASATNASGTREAKADDAETIDMTNPNKAAAQLRRRQRRKKSFDAILGDVLHDALHLRDQGEKPTVDFMHKRTQERMYEEEYGHKPPSSKDHAAKYVPFPPDFSLHRLIRMYPRDGYDDTDNAALERKNWPSDDRNGLASFCLFTEPDPWPERTITPENPVWTRRELDDDKEATGGKVYAELERRLYAPREGYDVTGEFLDAMDELAYWEAKLLDFLRRVPLSQRRSLPYLHEFHRMFVHRTIRAEKRYIATRGAALSQATVSSSVFKRTEEPIERVRDIYAEAHRSLSSPNYDPLRMKKSKLAPFMRMSAKEFDEWKGVQKQRRNALISELS